MFSIICRQIFPHTVKSKGHLSSTWSPLATIFNSKSSGFFELGYKNKETGLFEFQELKEASGYTILENEATSQSHQLINEATSNLKERRRKMVQIFDDLSDTLCKVADMAEFIRIAHPDKEFAQSAEYVCIAISGIVEKLNTNQQLYNALDKVSKEGDIMETTELDKHIAHLFLFDFEQCGIHLPDDQRLKVVELNDRILQCGQKFMAGSIEPRIFDMNILPDHLIKHFKNNGEQLIINSMNADSSNEQIRESGFRLYLYPDLMQERLLKDLLNSRQDLAQMCGFPTYAHRALRGSTAEKPEVVEEFLSLMNNELQHRVQEDFKILQKLKDSETTSTQPIMPWDTAYLASKARRLWMGDTHQEFAPYFSLGACMEGLNILTQALFGIKLECQAPQIGEVWTKDIHKLFVIDENGQNLGTIYCDFFSRPNKPNQDCHFTIRGGRELADGSYQNPIVVIMLSLPSPTKWTPPLLSPALAENLFHEMGHALHSMLGRTKYQHITGTRCSTDFAEVPSILMEYFSSDPRVVNLFAKHYQTGEPLPQKMLNQLCANKHIFPASELQSQVFYSKLDQVYHSGKIQISTTKILEEIQSQYYAVPYVKNTAWQLRFSHLVGYGAKYYSYLISRAIASWIWQTYFQNDPLSRCSGEKYRYECLAHGGGKPPSKLVSEFLHKEASPYNLTKSLINEIDQKTEYLQSKKSIIC